jgi:hypothetical protein
MARPKLRVWFDREADYLEVTFEDREGYFRETSSDHVMEKVDRFGRIIGFNVLRVSALHPDPLTVSL